MTTIEICGPIGPDGFGAADLAEALAENDQIRILLNSGGGCARTGAAIADLIDEHGLHVDIHRAVSAAAIVATAGPCGTIASDGHIATHPAWRALAGGYREFQAAAEELKEIDEVLDQMLSKRSSLTPQQSAQATRRGRVWTADEALADGLVDHIGPPAGLDTPPQQIIDGPAREHYTLFEQAKVYRYRAALERGVSTETTDSIDGVDRRMSALVEAFSPPDRLAGIFEHAAGDAKFRHLYPGRDRTLGRWRCDCCGHLNFTPPAVGLKPSACINCNATGVPKNE